MTSQPRKQTITIDNEIWLVNIISHENNFY